MGVLSARGCSTAQGGGTVVTVGESPQMHRKLNPGPWEEFLALLTTESSLQALIVDSF